MTAATGLVFSVTICFVGLAVIDGFRPGSGQRWLTTAVTGYPLLVPVLRLIVPPIHIRMARLLGMSAR